VILSILEERLGFLGYLLRRLLGGAWAVITFFALPVMIFEKKGAFQAIKESGGIIKKTWGEALSAYIGLGAANSLLTFLGFLGLMAGVGVGMALGSWVPMAVAGGLAVLYWIGLAVLFSSLTQIFRAALYVYATSGTAPTAFNEEMMKVAFRSKQGNRWV
jgi:hypothetical protein